jgi:hypothetical protein
MLNQALFRNIQNIKKARTGDSGWKYTYPEWGAAQLAFLKSDSKKMLLRAPRRCLAEGTEVLTPHGPIPIEQLSVGDIVYGYDSDRQVRPTIVKHLFNNGVKEVAVLTSSNKPIVEATQNHIFVTAKQNREAGKEFQHTVGEITEKEGYLKVRREFIDIPCGDVDVPDAYALAAFLGDGCSLEPSLSISSEDSELVEYVGTIVQADYIKRNHPNNYTWRYVAPKHLPTYYKEWCYKRKAHEKIADLDVIKTWNRKTCLRFLAGLIDTDGSVRNGEGLLTLSVSMQAETVMDAVEYIMFQLTQHRPIRTLDDRKKYVNGPVHEVTMRSNRFSKKLLKELSPYLQCERKQWKEEYSLLLDNNTAHSYIGLKKKRTRLVNTYDIHVANDTNLYLLANEGLITHNSGKTICLAERMLMVANTPKIINGQEMYGGYVYICLTKHEAKAIIWKELKEMCKKRGLVYTSHEVDLRMTFPNGGFIEIQGAGLQDSVNKARGRKNFGVAVDEAAFIPVLKEIVDTWAPTLADYGGEFVLSCSPGKAPTGFFYECDVGNLSEYWEQFYLLPEENPAFKGGRYDKFRQEQLQTLYGGNVDHPVYRREWMGEWVHDATSLLVKYDPKRNVTTEPHKIDWDNYEYFIGLDLGYLDSTAITVAAVHRYNPEMEFVDEFEQSELRIDEILAHVEHYSKKYRAEAIVVDSGGFGQHTFQELDNREGFPAIVAAHKYNKKLNIELLNNDLYSSRVKVNKKSCPKIIEAWEKVLKTPDGKEDDKVDYGNKYVLDILDSALYCHTYSHPQVIEKLEVEKDWGDKELERRLNRHKKQEMFNRRTGMGGFLK